MQIVGTPQAMRAFLESFVKPRRFGMRTGNKEDAHGQYQ
jgi:hypothetical protein